MQEIKQQVVALVTDVSPYVLPPAKDQAGGGGGGGDRDKLAASKGAAPKFAREQITPPAVVLRNDHPQLAVEPTVVGPPDIKLPSFPTTGDPMAKVFGPPSNGTGSGGGIGSGGGGGIGSWHRSGSRSGIWWRDWGRGVPRWWRSQCTARALFARSGVLRRSAQSQIPGNGRSVDYCRPRWADTRCPRATDARTRTR